MKVRQVVYNMDYPMLTKILVGEQLRPRGIDGQMIWTNPHFLGRLVPLTESEDEKG